MVELQCVKICSPERKNDTVPGTVNISTRTPVYTIMRSSLLHIHILMSICPFMSINILSLSTFLITVRVFF